MAQTNGGGSGGYHPPAHPAPVSGPGKSSRRTDGGPGQPIRDLPDAGYGEQQTFRQDQAGAPMAAAPNPAVANGQIQGPDLSGVVGLGEPTQRPGEPVTSGAASGPGPGPESLGLSNGGDDSAISYLRNTLPTLELMASMPMSTQAFRQYVRRVRAML
jgi:hypothetical protein